MGKRGYASYYCVTFLPPALNYLFVKHQTSDSQDRQSCPQIRRRLKPREFRCKDNINVVNLTEGGILNASRFRASPRSLHPTYTGGPVAITRDGRYIVTTLGDEQDELLVSEVDTGRGLARIKGVCFKIGYKPACLVL